MEKDFVLYSISSISVNTIFAFVFILLYRLKYNFKDKVKRCKVNYKHV